MLLVSTARAQQPEWDAPRVLILNSYHPQYEWTELLVRGVREGLIDRVLEEHIHVEYMDERRFVDDQAYEEKLTEVLRHKAARYPPSVIIASDDGAFRYLLRNRDDLYPGTPVVFCGVNVFDPETLEGQTGYTGILEGMEIAGNVRLIRDVQPNVGRIIMLTDKTSFGARMGKRAREVIQGFAEQPPDEGLELELWDDFTLEELYRDVGALESDTALLLLAIHEDKAGNYFSFAEQLPVLSQASTVPIYGMWGALLLGHGILGGRLNDPELHGRNTAALARRLIAGERVDDIPIIEKAVYMPFFDFRQMRRFGVVDSDLPLGSTVEFGPVSFYSQYRSMVWATLGLVVLLVSIIALLLANIGRRRQAETERGELAEQLRQSQKMEALGRLAGGISHDFNNLLTVILGNSEMLLEEEGEAGGSRAGVVKEIRAAGARAAALTRQLLAFSRKQIVKPIVVDSSSVINGMESLLRRLIRENIQLTVEASDTPSFILADPSQLEQIVMNLVVNAVDSIAGQGSIMIRLDSIPEAATTEPGNPYPCVRLTVADTGTGMAPATRAHIFEPFFTTKPVGKGTGLGLSTVYGTVQQLGGTISVKSAQNKGSTFEVLLPRVEEGTAEERAETSHEAPHTSGTILLCEDEDPVRHVISRILHSAGYTVIETECGDEALEVAASHDGGIDILISDIIMPGMNGKELAETLLSRCPDVRVLFVSGHPSDAIDFLGEETFAYEFLPKPLDTGILLQRVREILDGRRTSMETSASET
ncbi:MAG: response regulator [bacterium]|nr:response regulator [bacterium]